MNNNVYLLLIVALSAAVFMGISLCICEDDDDKWMKMGHCMFMIQNRLSMTISGTMMNVFLTT